MKHLIVIALFAAVVGCGKKSSSGGPSCSDAVNKAVAAMPSGGGGDEIKPKLTEVMTKRCTDDKWSAEARNCYATQVTDMQSMKKCRSMLTQDQQDKVLADLRTVMMGAMGGGGPMHGAGGAPMPPDGSGMQPPPAGSAEAGSAAAPAGTVPTGSAAP